jgi:hypothetical protein
VAAVALRVLIEKGDEGQVDTLIGMIESDDWETRWAGCKVLRRIPGLGTLPDHIEKRFLPYLTRLLENPHEYLEIQNQVVLALGAVEHRKEEAAEVLARALRENRQDWVKRSCVDGLRQIKWAGSKDALLYALKDEDAEIRVRAAETLDHVLGTAEAVGSIVEQLLSRDQLPRHLIDALRQIGDAAAANHLAERLLDSDPKISTRALRALTLLGGEEAVRSLQAQRTKALDRYTELLGNADKQIMVYFERIMGQASFAFKMSMGMHGSIFLLGVGILVVGLYFALAAGFDTYVRFIGAGAAASSMGVLLAMFYRDPLKNIRESLTGLVQVNIIFLGYIRQINQTDATFKQLFLASAGFGVDQMKQTVAQIQDSVMKTMDQVKVHLSNQ